MNKEFLKYVESTRDCDAQLLDIAIDKGLRRARSDRLDYKKIIKLATACAATIVLCVTINTAPISTAAPLLMQNSNLMTEIGTEIVHGYLNDIVITTHKYLGGD